MDEIVTLIQTVGFPIACAVAMFVMLQREQQSHKAETDAINTAITDMKITFSEALHNQENNITSAINNNTLVIQKLLDKLGDD